MIFKQYFTSTFVIWSLYCGTVGVLFIVLKITNARFHYLFDTTEPVEQPMNEEPVTSPSSASDPCIGSKNKKEKSRNPDLAEA